MRTLVFLLFATSDFVQLTRGRFVHEDVCCFAVLALGYARRRAFARIEPSPENGTRGRLAAVAGIALFVAEPYLEEALPTHTLLLCTTTAACYSAMAAIANNSNRKESGRRDA